MRIGFLPLTGAFAAVPLFVYWWNDALDWASVLSFIMIVAGFEIAFRRQDAKERQPSNERDSIT